ncbi:MAG: translation elongation factor Ts [Myxococcota bacterium]
MASVSIQSIKELRERTSAGMTDCKKALTEAEGDMEKAVELILKRGQAKSAKRAGKVAAEGEVRTRIIEGGRAALVVEVNIETDFSARNDKFQALLDRVVASAAAAPEGANLAALESDGKTLEAHATELTGVIGEKITLRRHARLAVGEGRSGLCHDYVHLGGRIGVIVCLETSSEDVAGHEAVRSFAEDTALQIAAMNPQYLRRDDVDASAVAKQKEIFEAQLREDPKPKPEKVWPKIIEGKVNNWFKETVLLDQDSAQHAKKSIDGLRAEAARAAGGEVTVMGFVRFELGEGIEKKEENFAADVAELLEQ